MMTPAVSVIIPAYNVAPYIVRAVQSALEQKDIDIEVIVVENASTDGTMDALKTFSDQRVKILQQTENLGPGHARNVGICAAQGKWLAIMDGDDSFTPTRLRRMIDLAQKEAADIVVDNLLIVPEPQSATQPMFSPPLFDKMDTIGLLDLMAGPLGGTGHPLSYLKPVFSAAFVKKHNIKYDPGLWVGEDYLIMAESLVLNAKCVVDHNTGYHWTKRMGSVSSRIPSMRWQAMIDFEQAFANKHALKGERLFAHQRRITFMNKMKFFEQAIESLKRRDFTNCAKIICKNPSILPLFKEPLMKRLPMAKHK